MGRAFNPNALDFLRREDFGAKTPRLGDRAPGQVRAAEPHGKAKIIFNARTPACLSTGSFPLNEQCVQTIRRTINRGRQAGRTGAHDDQIVKRKLRFGFQSQLAGDVNGGWVAQERAVRENDNRQ